MLSTFVLLLIVAVANDVVSALNASTIESLTNPSWLTYGGSHSYNFFLNYNGPDFVMPSAITSARSIPNAIGFPVVDSNGVIYTMVSSAHQSCWWVSGDTTCNADLAPWDPNGKITWSWMQVPVTSAFMTLDNIGNLYFTTSDQGLQYLTSINIVTGNENWRVDIASGNCQWSTTQIIYDSVHDRIVTAYNLGNGAQYFVVISSQGQHVTSQAVGQYSSWPVGMDSMGNILFVTQDAKVMVINSNFGSITIGTSGACSYPISIPYVVGTNVFLICKGSSFNDGTSSVYIINTLSYTNSLLTSNQCQALVSNGYVVYLLCISPTGVSTILAYSLQSKQTTSHTFPNYSLQEPMFLIGNVILTATGVPTTFFSWNILTQQYTTTDFSKAIQYNPSTDGVQLVTPYIGRGYLELHVKVFYQSGSNPILQGGWTDYVLHINQPSPSQTPSPTSTHSRTPSITPTCSPTASTSTIPSTHNPSTISTEMVIIISASLGLVLVTALSCICIRNSRKRDSKNLETKSLLSGTHVRYNR